MCFSNWLLEPGGSSRRQQQDGSVELQYENQLKNQTARIFLTWAVNKIPRNGELGNVYEAGL